MNAALSLASRSLLTLGILGALTFGAAEAFAGSRPDRGTSSRPWCDPVQCSASCGGYGICSGYNCYCY
jgi:hypothetical protein